MEKRVVVTGLGIVSPMGIGKVRFFESLKMGISGGKRMDRVKDSQGLYPLDLTGCKALVGAPVLDFNPKDFMPAKEANRLTRCAQFGIAAAKLAFQDAGIEFAEKEDGKLLIKSEDPQKIGVIMGTGIGGLEVFEENHENFLKQGARRVSPFFVPMLMPNSIAGAISIHFGLKGFSLATISACASSNYSIALGSELLKSGRASLAVAGGSEAVLTPLMFAALSKVRATTRRNDQPAKASRPFDQSRDGFLPAEGAGVLILETLEHAQKRGAHIYAEVKGYGMSDDAYHITAPDPEGTGAKESMLSCLQYAQISPEQVDYINAHGTSTPLNDMMETKAIKAVFGQYAYQIPISSTKSQTGHLMGAAGAMEAIATIYALQESIIPPTINYETFDPECDLNYTPNQPMKKEVRVAISNSFGFGGHNGTLCLTSFDEKLGH